MPPATEVEPTISADERLQTYTLGGAATGTGRFYLLPSLLLHNKPRRDPELNTRCILHLLLHNTEKFKAGIA
jgi:hypothetical protein